MITGKTDTAHTQKGEQMDAQIKRGLLDICVLAAIRSAPSYGYRIIKDVKPYLSISESTLYPILRRLEEQGSLTVYSEEHNGRLRKYYRIEDPGVKRLEEFQNEWTEIMSIYEFVSGKAAPDDNSETAEATPEAIVAEPVMGATPLPGEEVKND